MNDIVIRRAHGKTVAEAHSSAEHLIAELQSSFALKSHWSGDTLHFERPGVNGELALDATEAVLTVHLNFLLAALKPSIEREVHRYFDENFGAQPD